MALVDWARGGTDLEILEREDGFVDTGAGPEVYLAPFGEWPAVERRAMRHVRGQVLDVGCGAGRVALHLQERGADVRAIDRSELAVTACRIRGLRRVRAMSVDHAAGLVSQADTIVLFGNNLGIFGRRERSRALLRAWAEVAAPGTHILAESTNPYLSVPAVHRAYHRLNRERGRFPGQARLRVRYRNVASPWFDWFFVSQAELRKLVAGTGWMVGRTYESPSNPLYVAILRLTP
jgi:SAM-dependent methyltransferase